MANEQAWAEGVNKRVLRDGNGWNTPTNFKEDATRSGKRKRRLYATQQKRQFQVKMYFNPTEYALFDNWFNTTLKFGLYPFAFPQIDAVNGQEKYYRFTSDGVPQYSNVSGQIISCSMVWEEA